MNNSAGAHPDLAQPVALTSERGASTALAALFHALGDPTRVLILGHLLGRPHNVRELTDHLGLAQSTVSQHLACLRDCGLVGFRVVGRASVYAVTEPDEVRGFLADAERLLSATGDAATTCPSALEQAAEHDHEHGQSTKAVL